MEAKELRIGNYVNEFWWSGITGTYEKTLLKISLVCESHIRCQEDQASNLDEIEGVSLTEEWLLKFGFEFKFEDEDDNSIYVLNEFEITKDCFKDEFWIDANIATPDRIETVHQLQNLFFSLTGEELTVSN